MDTDVQFVWPLTLRGADQGPNRMDVDVQFVWLSCARQTRGSNRMDMDVQFVWPLTPRGADQGPNRMDMDGSGCTRVGLRLGPHKVQ